MQLAFDAREEQFDQFRERIVTLETTVADQNRVIFEKGNELAQLHEEVRRLKETARLQDERVDKIHHDLPIALAKAVSHELLAGGR